MRGHRVGGRLSESLQDNLKRLQDIFSNCGDLAFISWSYGPKLAYRACSIYFHSLFVDNHTNFMKETLQDLVTHQVGEGRDSKPRDIIQFFENNGVASRKNVLADCVEQVVEHVLKGDVVILFDHWSKAVCFEAIAMETRQVTEPTAESVVQGPREGMVENLQKNIGLLRTRLRNPGFKLETFRTGGRTRTQVTYGYLEGVVAPDTLSEFKNRIAKVKEAEILETSYVEECIEESTYSPFPQYRYTERPDTAVAALLEGKIIVLVQGTGSILICPGLFTEFFQSSEDYYQRTAISTLIRLIRIVAFFIALTMPSIYIALTTFHPELIPTVLLLAIIDAREGIPFPSLVEALIMQFFFELLREAGIRLPKPIGSAVSIVGALVIGEAAINAGIASPIMVVIVALTGIASFAIPQYTIAIPLRILQLPMMLLAATLGIFGLMIGMLWIVLHLCTLRVLGQPYLQPLAPLRPKQLMDVFVRAPLKTLMRSPRKKHSS